MSRQPDGWDLVKVLSAIGMVAGLLALVLGEKKGGSFAKLSAATGLLCAVVEPPVCNNCDLRTTYDAHGDCFRCPSCALPYLKWV